MQERRALRPKKMKDAKRGKNAIILECGVEP